MGKCEVPRSAILSGWKRLAQEGSRGVTAGSLWPGPSSRGLGLPGAGATVAGLTRPAGLGFRRNTCPASPDFLSLKRSPNPQLLGINSHFSFFFFFFFGNVYF